MIEIIHRMNRCPTGKQSYPTASATWRAIPFLSRSPPFCGRKKKGKPRGKAYRCPQCGQWHIASTRRDESPVKTRQKWQEEE